MNGQLKAQRIMNIFWRGFARRFIWTRMRGKRRESQEGLKKFLCVTEQAQRKDE